MADKGACAACPWRTKNQGTPHPHGWYTKSNLARLWAKLRHGDSMSCHPTDPNVEVPEGTKPVPEGTETRECMGGLILQQREMMRFQDAPSSYPKRAPQMTKRGLAVLVNRSIFSMHKPMPLPDLNDSDVQYEPLGKWERR